MLRFITITITVCALLPAAGFAQEQNDHTKIELPDVDTLLEHGPTIDAAPTAPEASTKKPTLVVSEPPKQVESEPTVEARTETESATSNATESKNTTARKVLKTVSRILGDASEQTARITDSMVRFSQPTDTLQLTPTSNEETWRSAVTHLESNQCQKAHGELQKAFETAPALKDNLDATYLQARIDWCRGKRSDATKKFQELAKRGDGHGTLAKLALGTSRDALQPGQSLSSYLKAVEASTDPKQALDTLSKLRRDANTTGERRRIDLARAKVLAKSGQVNKAKRAFLKLYRSTLGRRFNDTVEVEVRRFERTHKVSVLSYGENIDLMRKLIMRGKYKDAQAVSVQNAKARGIKGDEVRGWMYYRQALQAEHKKKREDAAELFKKAEKLIKDSEVRPRLYYGYSRALRRLDRDSEAIEYYVRLCKEYPRHHLCDDALYEAGRLHQYADDHKKAIAKFSKVLKQFKDPDHAADAVWRRGFSYYLTNQYAKARADFETLGDKFGHLSDASELSLGLKAKYWRAVTLQKEGQQQAAILAYRDALRAGPLTWYGRLSATRLEELGQPAPDALAREIMPGELDTFSTLVVPNHPRLQPAAVLTRIGLFDEAKQWLQREASLHPSPTGTERFLSAMYLKQSRPDLAHWVMKRHIEESGPTQSSMRDFAVAFPNDYLGHASKFGTPVGVSPYLVSAIIRQESGFRPKVKSWAGAVGLMQLMPGTARYVANRFGNDLNLKYTRSQLTDIDTNIKLGSMYIRVHTAHANDAIPVALAGYNAGPAPLQRWVKRYGDRELDAWVESITYREARGYVRKVYTSYVRYAALYGGELPTLNLKVPALRPWGVIPEAETVPEGTPVSFYTFEFPARG